MIVTLRRKSVSVFSSTSRQETESNHHNFSVDEDIVSYGCRKIVLMDGNFNLPDCHTLVKLTDACRTTRCFQRAKTAYVEDRSEDAFALSHIQREVTKQLRSAPLLFCRSHACTSMAWSNMLASPVTVIALIILLSSPIQSMSMHRKRWSFNTWRLHGSRTFPASTPYPTTGLYRLLVSTEATSSYSEPSSTTAPMDINQIVLAEHDYENDPIAVLTQFLRVLEMMNREQHEKTNSHPSF